MTYQQIKTVVTVFKTSSLKKKKSAEEIAITHTYEYLCERGSIKQVPAVPCRPVIPPVQTQKKMVCNKVLTYKYRMFCLTEK